MPSQLRRVPSKSVSPGKKNCIVLRVASLHSKFYLTAKQEKCSLWNTPHNSLWLSCGGNMFKYSVYFPSFSWSSDSHCIHKLNCLKCDADSLMRVSLEWLRQMHSTPPLLCKAEGRGHSVTSSSSKLGHLELDPEVVIFARSFKVFAFNSPKAGRWLSTMGCIYSALWKLVNLSELWW